MDVSLRPLTDEVAIVLADLRTFLIEIPSFTYSQLPDLQGTSPIGTHVRHILDHFDAFFVGKNSGVIEYDRRDRDPETEVSPDVAIERTDLLIKQLGSLSVGPSNHDSIKVRTAISSRATNGSSESLLLAEFTVNSTLGRELVFNVSHLIHHMAIIKILATDFGIKLHPHFGKAPSTIAYETQREQVSV